jgi:hypothetical protein
MDEFYGIIFVKDAVDKYIRIEADDYDTACEILEKYIEENYSNDKVTFAFDYADNHEDIN